MGTARGPEAKPPPFVGAVGTTRPREIFPNSRRGFNEHREEKRGTALQISHFGTELGTENGGYFPGRVAGCILLASARHQKRSLGEKGGHDAQKKFGVGNGNRTRNRRSHSPVLYQLSYSHHYADYTTEKKLLAVSFQLVAQDQPRCALSEQRISRTFHRF